MMTKYFSAFKKNFLNTFIAGVLLVFSTFFFLYLVRVKFKDYLAQIAAYTSESQALQQGLNAGTLAPYDSQIFLDKFSALTTKALVFGYVIVPIVLLILTIIFVSIIFKQIRDGNMKNYASYLKKFSVIAILSVVICVAITFFMFSGFNNIFNSVGLLLLAIEALLFYFTLINICMINEKPIINRIKESFRLGIRKFLVLFPTCLVIIILIALIGAFISILFTSFTLGMQIWIPAVLDVLLILFVLIALIYLENLFYLLTKKYS